MIRIPFDITAKECEESAVENRTCEACTFMNILSNHEAKPIKHSLQDISKMNLHKEKLLAELSERNN